MTTITVTGTAPNGSTAQDAFDTRADNVNPTAIFNAPDTALFNTTFGISLTSPSDAGSADTLTYAFKCGAAAYSSPSASNSATCTAPSSPGTFTVKGKILDDDGGSTEYTDTVTITKQDIDVSSPAGHAFGNQAVGTTSAPFTFTVTNEGTASLTITGVTITGSSYFLIDQNDCDGATLAPDGECDVDVVFRTANDGGQVGHPCT